MLMTRKGGGLAKMLGCQLLYEDQHVLCVSKWLNVAVQGAPGSMAHTLKQTPATREYRIVHRLDKDTTGVMVIAKHEEALKRLSKAFEEGKVEKTYLAITVGTPYPLSGTVSADLGIDKATRKWTCAPENNKMNHNNVKLVQSSIVSACTKYKVLSSLAHHAALVKLSPQTGKRHQLRIHCAGALSTPILGDPLYGGHLSSTVLQRVKPKRTDRDPPMCLHSKQIRIPGYRSMFQDITHAPTSKTSNSELPRNLVVDTKLPRHFQRFMSRLDLD